MNALSPENSVSYGCRGGIDFFYINAGDGKTYPCGFRGSENLGDFWNLNMHTIAKKPFCQKCDWECFRDPTNLLSPVMSPLSLLDALGKDRKFLQLALNDIRYYAACDYFNGTVAPDYKKLAAYSTSK